MEASDFSSGSYAWKNILKDRDVLKRGTRLPSKNHLRILSPTMDDLLEDKVSSLINHQTRSQDESLLVTLFSPQEVQLIKSIPHGNVLPKDFLYWPHSSSGNYNVKSGYNFLSQDFPTQDIVGGTSNISSSVWKNIWSLKVLNKVKNLLWRACKNAIPTKTNLVRGRVLTDDVCEQCQQSPEDVNHALGSCPCIFVVWDSYAKWSFHETQHICRFMEVVQRVINKGNILTCLQLLFGPYGFEETN